jgi:hypothetical protein
VRAWSVRPVKQGRDRCPVGGRAVDQFGGNGLTGPQGLGARVAEVLGGGSGSQVRDGDLGAALRIQSRRIGIGCRYSSSISSKMLRLV